MYITKKATATKEDKNMKRIEYLEQMASEQKPYKGSRINTTFGHAYFSSQRCGNEEVDFNDVIWDNDLDQIAENLKEFGISEFTISSTFSSLINTLAELEKRGYRMAGLTEVNAPYTNFMENTYARIPAIRMQEA